MRPILRTRDLSEESLRLIKQMGVDDVCVYAPLVPGYEHDGHFDLEALRTVRRQVEGYGLRFASVYLAKLDTAQLLLDRPGWQRDLDHVCRTIQAMGRVGIPVLEHSLLASRAIRDTTQQPVPGYWMNPAGRGGAVGQSFDEERARLVADEPAGSVSADQMWERITRFQERCVPVAAEAGVHLACHPDDPPIQRHWGVAQALNSVEGLSRLIEIVPSEYNGLLFCLGTMQESGADVIEALRLFGGMGKIFDIDFRNVRGVIPRYDEVFLDEGDLDMWQVILTLKEVNYQWTLEPDHVPGVINDLPGSPISKAWAVGYLKGLIAAAADRSSDT